MAKILVIDDEPLVLSTIIEILSSSGHEVFEATNGQDGLALFETIQVDLVITDVIMPKTDGIEVVLELKRMRPDIKIIAISGGGRTNNMNLLKFAGEQGAAKMLQKPFSVKSLLDAVDDLLAN